MRVIYSVVVSWKIQVRESIEKLKALVFARRYFEPPRLSNRPTFNETSLALRRVLLPYLSPNVLNYFARRYSNGIHLKTQAQRGERFRSSFAKA